MADTTPTLRDAAQRLLKAIEGVRQAETSQGHGRNGFIRTAPTHEHQRRVAEAWRKQANAADHLRAALAEQAAEQAEPVAAERTRIADGLLLKFQSAVSNVTRIHREYMGIAMPDDVYSRFATLRDETIPALRSEILAMIATPAAEQAEPVAVPAGYALVPVEPTEAMLAAAATACDDRFYPADMRLGPRAMDADKYRAMIAAAPPAPARQEWQPIETAPRDGTAFRGFHESLIDLDFNPCGSVECAWDGEQFIGCVWNGQQDAWYGKPVDLSHWMPLPAAPITAAPAEGGA